MLSRSSIALLRSASQLTARQPSQLISRANSSYYWATPPRNRVSTGARVAMGVGLYLVWFLPLTTFLYTCKKYRTPAEESE